jgi:hypothetical protein
MNKVGVLACVLPCLFQSAVCHNVVVVNSDWMIYRTTYLC